MYCVCYVLPTYLLLTSHPADCFSVCAWLRMQLPFKLFLTLINILTFLGQYLYNQLYSEELQLCVVAAASHSSALNTTATATSGPSS